jgi:transposase
MSLRFKPGLRVFVYAEAIDMRWGFSRLQALVAERLMETLFEGHLFLFLGRNRRRAKMLLFDGTGLVLIIKRLDRNTFMSVTDLFSTREITQEELARLLDGANLRVTFAAAKRAQENLETA